MKESFNGPEFLGQKFQDIHTSEEAQTLAEYATKKEELSHKQTKHATIDRYLRGLDRVMKKRPSVAKMIEESITDDYVLDTNNEELVRSLARDLYESEKKIAIQQGRGGDIQQLDDEEILNRYRQNIIEKAKIQKESLQSWITYLKEGEDYPMWFKYYVIRSLKDMGQFNRDTTSYSTRTENTIAPFPEMNAEALAFVKKSLDHQLEIESIELPKEVEELIQHDTKLSDDTLRRIESLPKDKQESARKGALRNARTEATRIYIHEHRDLKQQEYLEEIQLNEARKEELIQELKKRLSSKDFADLYAFAQVECAGSLNRESLEGEWVVYPQGSDYRELEKGLKGKGTGWCTATGSAQGQLENGDFHVFYTKNKAGVPTEPRIAVRMEDHDGVQKIAEIRGIDPGQALEPALVDIAKEYYSKLDGAERYEKADRDMKMLTAIYAKCFEVDAKTGERKYLDPELSKAELQFIYELDEKIKGFGYERDIRINEITAERDIKADISRIYECGENEIAYTSEMINSETKVYIGDLAPGLFTRLPISVKAVFKSFPKERILIAPVEGANLHKLEDYDVDLTEDAKLFFDKHSPTSGSIKRATRVVFLSLEEMGLNPNIKCEEILIRAKELGLNICKADISLEILNQGIPLPDNHAILFTHPIIESISDAENLLFMRYDEADKPRLGTVPDIGRSWRGPRKPRIIFAIDESQ